MREAAGQWKILGLLAVFSLVNYSVRTNVSVAAKFMMPDLGLTQVQIGQIFSAFMLAYALFQIPAGVIGDRFGPRIVLAVAAASWSLLTFLTGSVPGIVVTSASGILFSLFLLRFLLGATEAATYPVATRAIASWVPSNRRSFANSIVIAGMAVGSACTPPLIAWMMVTRGWRESLYVTAVPPFLLAFIWWRYAGRLAASVPSRLEKRSSDTTGAPVTSWLALLHNRDVTLLSVSYFLESYIQYIFLFWFYLYLVDVRGFALVQSGFLTSLPYVVSGVSMPLAGFLSDRLSERHGRRFGRCVVVLTGFFASAGFLAACAGAPNPWVAVVGVSLSVGFVLATEGPFWSTATDISLRHAGAAGGVMNTAGNLAGVAAASLVPILVRYRGWSSVFVSSSILSAIAGLLWLLIRFPRAARETGNEETSN